MDIAILIISSGSLGIALAAVGYVLAVHQDMRDDLKDREDLRAEFQQTLHKIAQEHNKLVGQLAQTADQVSDLALRASMGARKG